MVNSLPILLRIFNIIVVSIILMFCNSFLLCIRDILHQVDQSMLRTNIRSLAKFAISIAASWYRSHIWVGTGLQSILVTSFVGLYYRRNICCRLRCILSCSNVDCVSMPCIVLRLLLAMTLIGSCDRSQNC